MIEKKEFLRIQIKEDEKSVRGVLHSVEFEDHGHYVIFVPSLNLSAYGDNKMEAHNMLKAVVDDFCETLTELPKKEMLAELSKFGWQQSKLFKKQFEKADSYIDKEGILKEFDLAEDTKIREEYVTV